ncbi:MAG: hypothetical protein SFY68_09995 [Candidatus Sumerlaeia bacterium]|nr:hypothetical protein [Candidatus Sumerlaeia bacterium]
MTSFLTKAFALLLLVALLPACSRTQKIDPYAPHETLLGIATEFKLLDSGDPYRSTPPQDLTGQHIAKATLVRLANYEELHPDRFPLEIRMLKARCYEWLGDSGSARDLFAEVAAQSDSPLAAEAAAHARLHERILAEQPDPTRATSVEAFLGELYRHEEALLNAAQSEDNPLFQALLLKSAEDLAVRRVEVLAGNRLLVEEDEQQILEQLRRLITTYGESARGRSHVARLARFHRELAEEELRLHPPSGIRFDRARCLLHLNEALDILHQLAQEDGTEEKLVAQRELDTVLALRDVVLRTSR